MAPTKPADDEALRRSEARYRSLVENIPGSVVILFDRDTRFVLVDGPEVDLSGASKANMENKLPAECLPPEFAAVVERNFRAVLRGERFCMDLPWEDRMYHYEYVPLYGTDGTVEFGLAVGQNITRQTQIEAELRKSEQRFRALFETAPDAFVIHDLQGRLLDGNHAAEVLFDLDRRDVIGKTLFEVGRFDAKSLPRLVEAHLKIMRGESIKPTEVGFVRHDGRELVLELKAVPLLLADEKAVLASIRDVTERVEEAKARQSLETQLHQATKMEAIGRLAGGIAHDFNNLLTAILSNIDLAMEGLEPDDQRHGDLSEAMAATQRAAALVGQLLAFSRKQKIEPAIVELGGVVTNCARLIRSLVGESVKIEVSNLSPAWVRVDVGKFEQVLVNLAVNARDAMAGVGTLRFTTTVIDSHPTVESSGPHALVSVSDNGSGMSREVQERLFEPFFTTKPVGLGTGLGLSIVYGIIKQSDGHVRVRSTQAGGTTFDLYLPIASPPTPPG